MKANRSFGAIGMRATVSRAFLGPWLSLSLLGLRLCMIYLGHDGWVARCLRRWRNLIVVDWRLTEGRIVKRPWGVQRR